LYYITIKHKNTLKSSTNVNYITNILSPSTTNNLLNELHTKLQVLGIFIIIPVKSTIKSVKNKIVEIINHIVMDVEKINTNYQDLKDMYNYV